MPRPLTWLDRARAAGDYESVSAYLDEQLGPIAFAPFALTAQRDHLMMRWHLLHLTQLPNVDAHALISVSAC